MSLQQQWSRISSVRLKHAADLSDLLGSEDEDSIIRPYRTLTKRLLFPAEFKEDDEANSPRLLMYPESRAKTLWDLVAGLCISMQAMLIPVFLAFEPLTDAWAYLDLGMLAFFTLDILISFNLAYYELGALVTDRRRIAINYLSGWCLFDVMATFPFDLLLCSGLSCAKESSVLVSLKLFRFTKVLRLMRLAKLNRIIFMLEDISSSQLIASSFLFLRLVFILIIMAHWLACAWVFVGYINELSANNWLKNSSLEDESVSVIYVTALYWSLTTIISVGYGDTKPTNDTELAYVLISMVVSSVIFAYLLGSITAFIVQQTASESQHRERVLALNHFMKSKQLSSALRGKVKRYLEFVWEHTRNSPLETTVILPLLSKPLRNEIYAKTRGVVFSCCLVFGQQFAREVTRLSELLKQQIFAPEDIVFTEGELSSTIYFILEGTVDVYHNASNSSYKRLGNKQHFGEVAFFSKLPRTASVRCLCFTELFSLERNVMDDVCSETPEALIKLSLVEKNIIEGNLVCIGLSCYVCNKPGHVAINCKSVLIINNKEKIAKDWIQGRSRNSKFVNLHQSFKRNFSRKNRYVRPVLVRTLCKTSVNAKIETFCKEETREQLITTQSVERPRYSIIIDEDSEIEGEVFSEGARGSMFRKPFMRQTLYMQNWGVSSEVEEYSSEGSSSL
mmetsp:Transcript_25837/g.45637  ORF Transcript_25837/g.45637 Transcript_25837/m.45637 type:complete len:677 (-) Transcript_25837:47-2077(-)